MVQYVPSARGESRSLRQGLTPLDRRDERVSREVFRTRSAVHECVEVISVRRGIFSGVPAIFALEVTGVCDFFSHLRQRSWSCGHLGHYGAATELGRFVIMGIFFPTGQEGIARDWDGPEGEISWGVGISRGPMHQRRCHEHVVGVPTGLRFTEVKIHFARECLPS